MAELPTFENFGEGHDQINLLSDFFGGTASSSNLPSLNLTPGSLVEVTLSSSSTNTDASIPSNIRGVVVAYTSELKALILQLQQGNMPPHQSQSRTGGYTLIPSDQIASVNVIESSSGPTPVSSLDSNVVNTKLEAAIRLRQEDAAKIGKNVSEFAQQLFFSLAKTLPCRWDNQTIVVMDNILIAPPYTAESCSILTGDNKSPALERIKSIVANHKA